VLVPGGILGAVDRVAVVGSGGAGKSTFSRELGGRTGIPVVHLDQHFWRPGWVETPRDEWRAVQRDLLGGPRWIADGNYGGTLDVRLERADTVIILALSRWVCTSRVLRHTLRHRGRDVQAEGCPERFELKFVRWVWAYPVSSRRRLDAALARHPHLRVVELASPRSVRRYLDDIGCTDDGARCPDLTP
jgi:adenylate kinase family enzyme